MGALSRAEIEQLMRERREAKASKKRRVATRSRIVRFLIVCEGQCTEPNYFNALVRDRFSEVRSEEIFGEGRSTCSLVRKTDEIRRQLERKRQLKFDRVWIVFDKDDFRDFNEAIELATSKGYHPAWSNEAFELWYLLHFTYIDSTISRTAYIRRLEAEISRRLERPSYHYRKNDAGMYRLLQLIGDEEQAKRRAAKLRRLFRGSDNYKEHKPCTTVDILINELQHPEQFLNKK